MSKKELIQIRVSEDEKLKIKSIERKKGLAISEFLLYGAMKSVSEYEKNYILNNENDKEHYSLHCW